MHFGYGEKGKTMTKREVIEAMENKLHEMDEAEKMLNKPGLTALDVRQLREEYFKAAEKIAEENGYTGGSKWQLWDIVVTRRARKLGIRPNTI